MEYNIRKGVNMKRKMKSTLVLLGAFWLLLSSALIGYTFGMQRTVLHTQDSDFTPALRLSVIVDDTVPYVNLFEENTEDSFAKVSLRDGFAQAYLEVNGENIPLGDALNEEIITQAELCYLARLDAQNGFCVQTHETRNGLSHFTYRYPDFNLRVIYDVYITPDGNQDLIDHIVIYPVKENKTFGAYTDFFDPDTGRRTDREDWGLTFTQIAATPTSVTVHCRQSEGQQIGQLSIDWYFLRNVANDGESPSCEIPLTMNGETTFTIDWAEEYGELPSGEYAITLNIIDHFDERQVHPLMQDFHDWQAYTLEFTIP